MAQHNSEGGMREGPMGSGAWRLGKGRHEVHIMVGWFLWGVGFQAGPRGGIWGALELLLRLRNLS